MGEKDTNRYLWVDVLRGIAILMVVLVHTGQNGLGEIGLPHWLTTMIHKGERGVQLFFLMSAFTIILTYLRHMLSEQRHVSNFYIRRFFRIAPMFYLGILYYRMQDGFGGRFWQGDASGTTIANIFASMTFTHGFSPYFINSIVPGEWSIGVEMFFYFLFPILIIKLNTPKKILIAFALSLVGIGILQCFLSRHVPIASGDLWTSYLFFYFPSQLPIFLMGLMLFFAIERKNITPVQYAVMLVPAWISAVYKFPFIDNGILYYGAIFLLLAFAAHKTVRKNKTMYVLGWIGKVSYSLYLTHFLVFFWLGKCNLLDPIGISSEHVAIVNFALRYVLVLAGGIAISSMCYLCIEKPFIRLGNKIIREREARKIAQPA